MMKVNRSFQTTTDAFVHQHNFPAMKCYAVSLPAAFCLCGHLTIFELDVLLWCLARYISMELCGTNEWKENALKSVIAKYCFIWNVIEFPHRNTHLLNDILQNFGIFVKLKIEEFSLNIAILYQNKISLKMSQYFDGKCGFQSFNSSLSITLRSIPQWNFVPHENVCSDGNLINHI